MCCRVQRTTGTETRCCLPAFTSTLTRGGITSFDALVQTRSNGSHISASESSGANGYHMTTAQKESVMKEMKEMKKMKKPHIAYAEVNEQRRLNEAREKGIPWKK